MSVAVRLSAAHQGARGVTVPVVLTTAASALSDNLNMEESVTFEAGETRKSLTVDALHDDLVEGLETVTLDVGTLHDGLTAGSTATSPATVTDADQAQISFTTGVAQVAEGGETQLDFAITNGVAFERDESITLTLGGTATEVDDFTLTDSASQTLSSPYAVTFAAGASAAEVTLHAVDDTDIETVAETVTVSATLSSSNAFLGTRTVTIPPSDVPRIPTVSIAAGIAVTEGSDATFVLRRTESTLLPLSEPLAVSVLLTPTPPGLSSAGRRQVSFGAAENSAELRIKTNDDSVISGPGSVAALVEGSTSDPPIHLTDMSNAATVSVADHDVAVFSLSPEPRELAEIRPTTITVQTVGVTFAQPHRTKAAITGTAVEGVDFRVIDGSRTLSKVPHELTLPARAA